MAQPKRPYLKAGTDGERIVVWFKTGDRSQFGDVLAAVKAMPGAKFDWDEKVWHLPLTKPNADRIAALESQIPVVIAPALGAWVADRSITERVTALEETVRRLTQALARLDAGEDAESY